MNAKNEYVLKKLRQQLELCTDEDEIEELEERIEELEELE
jgi:hypothetical protein